MKAAKKPIVGSVGERDGANATRLRLRGQKKKKKKHHQHGTAGRVRKGETGP